MLCLLCGYCWEVSFLPIFPSDEREGGGGGGGGESSMVVHTFNPGTQLRTQDAEAGG